MNWDALGAVSELVGAVAVVATLIYLAVQIRQNTASNQNSALQTVSSQYADWLSLIIENEVVAQIYRKGLEDSEQLTADEKMRFGMLLTLLSRAGDAQYHQYDTNAVPEEKWISTLNSFVGVLGKPGARTWWNRYGDSFTPSFQAVVNGKLLHKDST